jgi:hypothetical protein
VLATLTFNFKLCRVLLRSGTGTRSPLVTFSNGTNGVCTDLTVMGEVILSVKIDCNGCFSAGSKLQVGYGGC